MGVREGPVKTLLRHHASKSGDEQISFEEFVDRMGESQTDILYATGAGTTAVLSSPFLETVRKESLEALGMVTQSTWPLCGIWMSLTAKS